MELAMEEASTASEGLRLKLTDLCEPWAEVLADIFCLLATAVACPGRTTDLFTAPFSGTLTPWLNTGPEALSASDLSAASAVGMGSDVFCCCEIMVARELMREGRTDGSIEARFGFSTSPLRFAVFSSSEPESSSEGDSIPAAADSLVPGLAMSICRFLRARGTDDLGES